LKFLGLIEFETGNLATAENLLLRSLRENPRSPDCDYYLGLLYLRKGERASARNHFRSAVHLDGGHARALANLGTLSLDDRCIADALEKFQSATRADPALAQAWVGLGRCLAESGRDDEALRALATAVALDRTSAEAHYLTGIVLCNLARYADALQAFDASLALMPGRPEAWNGRGNALSKMKRHADALAAFDKAIALDPKLPEAWNGRAGPLAALDRAEDALASLDRAIALRSDYREAFFNRGVLLSGLNRPDDAVASWTQARARMPAYAAARLAQCTAELPVLYLDEADIARRRAAYEARLRSLSDDVRRSGDYRALADAIGAIQPFFLPYQGGNDRELQRLYGSLACAAMSARFPPPRLDVSLGPDEPIRVGFVSGFFNAHSNWKIPIRGWVTQLDRRRFSVFGYHTGPVDAYTSEAQIACDRFVHGAWNAEEWRRRILADRPHVLIYPEVGMDSLAAQLAAQRLAPVQCNSWGHPVTSGFPTLDYYFSSDLMEPPDAQNHYCEQLVRLPNLSIYYEPIEAAPIERSRADFGLREDAVVFWCGQSLYKYLPQYDAGLARIARELTDCQFVFVAHESPTVTGLFRDRIAQAFAAHGLAAADRCVFLPRLSYSEFLAAIGRCDVMLDSIGWSGCNSILESLQCDIPVVTMPGGLMRGRHGAAILTMMGIGETVADDLDAYVAIAVRLGRDPQLRREAGGRIAHNKARVYRDLECIRALEEFLVRAVRERCRFA